MSGFQQFSNNCRLIYSNLDMGDSFGIFKDLSNIIWDYITIRTRDSTGPINYMWLNMDTELWNFDDDTCVKENSYYRFGSMIQPYGLLFEKYLLVPSQVQIVHIPSRSVFMRKKDIDIDKRIWHFLLKRDIWINTPDLKRVIHLLKSYGYQQPDPIWLDSIEPLRLKYKVRCEELKRVNGLP